MVRRPATVMSQARCPVQVMRVAGSPQRRVGVPLHDRAIYRINYMLENPHAAHRGAAAAMLTPRPVCTRGDAITDAATLLGQTSQPTLLVGQGVLEVRSSILEDGLRTGRLDGAGKHVRMRCQIALGDTMWNSSCGGR